MIVTHDQLEALTMADRIAVMRDGIIEQVATPHQIFTEPANLFVAGFIGTPRMNLIEATLTEGGESHLRFELGGQQVRLPIARPGLAGGSSVTLGVRPRACEFVSESGIDTISGEVDLVEPMGADTLVHLLHGDQDLRVVVDRAIRIGVGERAHLRFEPDSVHLFDDGGRRVDPAP